MLLQNYLFGVHGQVIRSVLPISRRIKVMQALMGLKLVGIVKFQVSIYSKYNNDKILTRHM